VVIIHEFPIPAVTGIPRGSVTIQLPQGAVVVGLVQPPGDQARAIVRGDPAGAPVERTFTAVRSDVALSAAEQAAQYVGSFIGYRTEAGLEVYHLLAL
jgi:hypothetical protein